MADQPRLGFRHHGHELHHRAVRFRHVACDEVYPGLFQPRYERDRAGEPVDLRDYQVARARFACANASASFGLSFFRPLSISTYGGASSLEPVCAT
jgi:hypothetical protein